MSVAACVLGAISPLMAACATLHVPADYATVGAALAASAAGDTIALAPATYLERVTLPPGRVLRGDGPAGSVVLDGAGGGSVVVCNAPIAGTMLDGLVLRGGSGEPDGAIRVGGGLVVRGGMLALTAVRIEDCQADIGGGLFADGATVTWNGGALVANGAAYGGGWYAREGSLRLTGVEVSANTANLQGGGGFASGLAPLEIAGGECRGNTAGGDGGGLYLSATGAAVHESRLTANSGARGAGLFVGPSSLATISYSVLFDNQASGGGGAFFVECAGPGGAACSEVRLHHVDLVANRAARSGAGLASGAARIAAEASLVVANQGGLGCLSPQSEVDVTCSVVYANGDAAPSEGCLPAYGDTIEVDPRLCDLAAGDLERCSNSPLLSSAPCGLPFVGALAEGCPPCGLTRTVTATWGRLKAAYR